MQWGKIKKNTENKRGQIFIEFFYIPKEIEKIAIKVKILQYIVLQKLILTIFHI